MPPTMMGTSSSRPSRPGFARVLTLATSQTSAAFEELTREKLLVMVEKLLELTAGGPAE